MRDDMAKVVTERPRQGHAATRARRRRGSVFVATIPTAEYDEPTRLPIARHRQHGYDAKEFSDLINPLKRYLRTCIGKPWRKVHSELSLKLDRRSVSGSHLWDHVMREIEIDCYIGDDGLAWDHDDIEVTTEHYRGGHASSAARSGFSCYGGSSLRIGGRVSGGGGGGGHHGGLAEELWK